MTDTSPASSTRQEAEKAFDHMESANFRTGFDVVVDRVGDYVSILFLLGMSISVFEILSRYLFASPTLWAHESTILIVAFSFAYGGTYCVARNSHISIKMIYDHVSPKSRQKLDILNALLCFVYTAMITWAAFESAEKSLFTPQGDFRLETSGSAWNPPIPPLIKTAMFICVSMMTVQNVLHFVKAIRSGPVPSTLPTGDDA